MKNDFLPIFNEFCEFYEVIILYGHRRITEASILIVVDSEGIFVYLLALKLLLPQFAEIGTGHFSRRGILCSCCI